MRTFAFAAAFLVLAACQKGPAPEQAAAPESAASSATAPKRPSPVIEAGSVEGWETSTASYSLLGATMPEFKAERLGGGEVTQNGLRGHWTILGFWSGAAAGPAKQEMNYIGALNSAADQDPDLDFLAVYMKGGDDFDLDAWRSGGSAWPTLIANEMFNETFGVEKAPAYLLIGPDLTIEAYRGALAATPDDGIKSVIRGVAEIKKQIAAPE